MTTPGEEPPTQTDDLPDGYVLRCDCTDLDPLTDGQAIKQLAETQQCQTCGTVWTLEWKRDPGGETQPEWRAIAPAPKNWTAPDDAPPAETS